MSTQEPDTTDRARGCLLGLAAGDAVGTTVEFSERGSFPPMTDLVGGGPFNLEPGRWTDDTSMALCLADSLIECEGFDPADQMRRFVRWEREGYLSSTGVCFDIGNTVAAALDRFGETGEPFSGSTHPRSAGNGSIMRLAPVVLCFLPDAEKVLHYAAESSRTTHGAAEAVNACRTLGSILLGLIQGESKAAGVDRVRLDESYGEGLSDIVCGAYKEKSEDQIVGSGYVVESLEAALWCFWNSESFEEAILRAANLGDDADTTAAICGQLAGAHWGASGIPDRWLDRLFMKDEIEARADALLALGVRS